MAAHNLYQEFIDKLQKDKSPQEAGKFIADLLKFSAVNIYYAIMTFLTDEDMEEIEKIPDDTQAMEEMKKRFALRTGYTPEEFVNGLRDEIAKNYLFPELNPNNGKTGD